MYRHFSRDALIVSRRPRALPHIRRSPVLVRGNSTKVEEKYADKLRERAKEQGLSLSKLKEKATAEQGKRLQQEKKALQATLHSRSSSPTTSAHVSASASTSLSTSPSVSNNLQKERKDSAPVRPLSTILNLERLFGFPHTPDQVTSLWTAYHVSRSGGTGRGYACAIIPLELYQKMGKVAQKYPFFVVALPRPRLESAEAPTDDEHKMAYEFYFLQWSFHDRPPVPKTSDNPFDVNSSEPSTNPQTSTVLFTPLEEYKLRGEFATPYLIQTYYTDLASTHGIVLLRGEITPSSTNPGGSHDRYLLSQEDAHLLSMAIQKFYLWNEGDGGEGGEGATLLRTFHDTPEDFNWQDLLKTAALI